MSVIKSENVNKALAILKGQVIVTADEMLELGQALKGENAFGYARMILERARKDAPLHTKLAQQHALCTVKDPDLPSYERLEQAERILEEADPLKATTDQETLGLAGGIYKRKWQLDAQKRNLERSLAYYERGYKLGATSDFGYTGINAAFILDLLADQESEEAEKAGTNSTIAEDRRKEAAMIREDLVTTLPPLISQHEWLSSEWWFFATVAEACFGLKRYDDASAWLKKGTDLHNVADWEYASTAQQLALLASLQSEAGTDIRKTPAWDVLKRFLGDNADAAQTVFAGKVGLALSGGGFRASLYHIGVLAKLAELDMLRHIEALSCVSGGSIIGAHYYLEIRRLLQEKEDSQITRDDYIDLVQRIERDFLAGVQSNVIIRAIAGLWTNFKMLFSQSYSRTERIGDLYESEIFSRIADGEGDKARWLNGLYILPKGTESFKPKYDNWRRRNKVPTLILNATALNTGHNWQFTASWMGESPASIDTDIDTNYLLRRMHYAEAPRPHQRVRLGHAVGSSSCVPGLFPPLALAGLYPDKTIRLVDGGVHDNQGVVGLLEQDCTVLLVSDSSGQMGTVDNPGKGMLDVPLRSNNILMARLREAEYHVVKARRRSSLLRGFMFVHLKKDLNVEPVDWIDAEKLETASVPDGADLTGYGVQKDVQESLAAIRTHLDSFCDAEAYALMTSGYRMTEYEFNQNCVENFPLVGDAKPDWAFLAVETAMTATKDHAAGAKLRKLLNVAAGGSFKIWKLWFSSGPLRAAGILLGFLLPVLAVLAGLLMGGWQLATLMSSGMYSSMLLMIPVGLFSLLVVAWLGARLHLHLFDKLYLRWGKIDHVVGS